MAPGLTGKRFQVLEGVEGNKNNMSCLLRGCGGLKSGWMHKAPGCRVIPLHPPHRATHLGRIPDLKLEEVLH